MLFGYAQIVLYTHFVAGSFGFHDLTLINDFLSNTIHGRGFFLITDYHQSHFTVHFTPTLILLTPLYLLFDSQFLLIGAGVAALYASFAVFLVVFKEIAGLAGVAQARGDVSQAWLAPLAFLLLMALNFYTLTVLLAASCWLFYSLFFALTVLLLVRRQRLWLPIATGLLALGIRQDAGFYFSLQILSLWFLPIAAIDTRRRFRRGVLVLSALGALYAIVCVIWIMPALGMQTHVDHGWQLWGANWPEVARTVVTSPVRVWDDLRRSAAASVNNQLLWLPIWNPWSWLLNNIPGVLLYISAEVSKRDLWYYNASFLLPGMLLASWTGYLALVRLLARVSSPAMVRVAAPALLVVLSVVSLANLWKPTATNNLRFVPEPRSRGTRAFRQAIDLVEHQCPNARRFSADFKNIVFLPNDSAKYLLVHYAEADVLLFPDGTARLPGNFSSSAEAVRIISSDPAFREWPVSSQVHAFIRRGFACTPGGVAP